MPDLDKTFWKQLENVLKIYCVHWVFMQNFKSFEVFYKAAATLLYAFSIECQVSVILKGVILPYGFDYLLL